MDESLADRAKVPLAKGLSEQEMRTVLLKAGWPTDQVTQYVKRAYKSLDTSTLLKVSGVAKVFGQSVVLDQVDFEVKRGEIFGLIGVSGAGKSTLLNVLVGFLRPDRGEVLLALPDGRQESVVRNPSVVKEFVGFSTQTPSFYPKLTVWENVAHFAALYHLTEPDLSRRCQALIELVGLKDAKDVIASQLSGGMQKRLDIACALIHDPELLILDEPTADLDPILRKSLWELIKEINAKGTTIMLASHFLAEIELLCSRIGILQNRRIVELGTAQELRSIYSRNYEVFVQTSSHRYEKLMKVLQQGKRYVAKVSQDDGELVIQTGSPEKVLALLSSQFAPGELESMHVSRPTLGQVFEVVVKR